MTPPDGLALITESVLFVSAALAARYRYHASWRRALEDEAEDVRLTGWVSELRTAGVEQSVDPAVKAMLSRYARIRQTGRHRASRLRPPTIDLSY